MNYDKPFLTYDEQIKKLKTVYKLNTSVNSRLEKTFLESISYYDLINGYKDSFMDKGNFKENISMSSLFYFKIFDRNFQNILFKYSVYAENSFKTKLAYILSEEYGEDIDSYLNFNNFQIDMRKIKKFKRFKNTIKNIRDTTFRSNVNPTKHYREKHNHIPAWILFKNVKFNDCINLFEFLKKDLKLKIIKRFYFNDNFSDDDYIRLFKSFISIIRKFRNKIAHNSKVITYRVEPKYELNQVKAFYLNPYSLIRPGDIRKKSGRNDLFSMILSLTIILDNPILVNMLLLEIKTILTVSSENLEMDIINEYIKITNLPIDLVERISNINFYDSLSNHLQKWK